MIPYPQKVQLGDNPMKIGTLAIITRGNKVLLGLKQGGSKIGEGTLNGPGGKFDPEKDKTNLDCVIRETEEEVGIVLNPAKLKRLLSSLFTSVACQDLKYMYIAQATLPAYREKPRAWFLHGMTSTHFQ